VRFFTTLSCVVLLCAAPLGGQIEGADPYSIRLVQNNMQIAEAGLAGTLASVNKHLQRLGDGISIALLKIMEEQNFTDPKTVEASLSLIRLSFSYPQIISLEADKKPKVTLFLLKHLDQNVFDSQTKRDIQETIQYVERQTKSQEQVRPTKQ